MSQTAEPRTVMVSGRIVWVSGDLFKGQKKLDMNTRQPRLKQDGTEMMEYGFGLAIHKSALVPGNPSYALWQAMQEEARRLYPNNVPPGFGWKYKDGDGVDHEGNSFATRQGYAGHIIFAMKTTFPIKFFIHQPTADGKGINVQVSEGIKCGDYVDVQVSVSAHAAQGQAKPGLYLNPWMVRLNQPGPAIVNTPSPDAVFGASAPQAIPGAIADSGPAPMASMPGMNPQTGNSLGAPGMGQFGTPGQMAGSPSPAAPMAPQPHYAVIPPHLQPTPTQGMMSPGPAQIAPSFGVPGAQMPGMNLAVPAAPGPQMESGGLAPAATGTPQMNQFGAPNMGGFANPVSPSNGGWTPPGV